MMMLVLVGIETTELKGDLCWLCVRLVRENDEMMILSLSDIPVKVYELSLVVEIC